MAKRKSRNKSRRRETEAEAWVRLYEAQTRLKTSLKPAYNNCVAPSLARVIEAVNKPVVKILVVGAGTGTFSEHLLPAVKSQLRHLRVNSRLEVLETDPVESALQRNPAQTQLADVGNLPFREEFDLVVGQSMIHQIGRGKVPIALRQIKKALKPDGFCFFVVDDSPNPKTWGDSSFVSGGSLAKSKGRKTALALQRAHINLFNELSGAFSAQNFNSGSFMGTGSAVVSEDHHFNSIKGLSLDKKHGRSSF
jgi:SAM-dependent methyltransferase